MPEDLDRSVRAIIGVPQYETDAGIPANERNSRAMCAAVENANPAWWDEAAAQEAMGGHYCPATMLPAWGRPELWEPATGNPPKALQAHFDLKAMLSYAASVAVSYETTFFAPVPVGARFRTRQVIRNVGPVKTTRLGTGRFWTVDMEYLDSRGELAGVESYEFFGFTKDVP